VLQSMLVKSLLEKFFTSGVLAPKQSDGTDGNQMSARLGEPSPNEGESVFWKYFGRSVKASPS
jgi:hypothetical protein